MLAPVFVLEPVIQPVTDALAVPVVLLLVVPLVAVVLDALDHLAAAVAVIAPVVPDVLDVDRDVPDVLQGVQRDAKDATLVQDVVQAVVPVVRLVQDLDALVVDQAVPETVMRLVMDAADALVVVKVAAQVVVVVLDNAKVDLVVSTVVVVSHVPDVWVPAEGANHALAAWVSVMVLAKMLALEDVDQHVPDAHHVVDVRVVLMVEHITVKDVLLDVQQDVDPLVEMAAMDLALEDVLDALAVDQDVLEDALEAVQVSAQDALVVDQAVRVDVKVVMLVALVTVHRLVAVLVQQPVLQIVVEPAMVKQL